MIAQLPTVEIVEDPHTFITGVAIRKPGHDIMFVVPFYRNRLDFAYALNLDAVLLASEDGFVKIDISSGKELQRISRQGNRLAYLLSRDQKSLYAVGHFPDSLLLVDVESLTVKHAYNVALMSGKRGRLAHTREYFTIDRTFWDGDARIFHSEELKAEYNSPETSPLTLSPNGSMEEIQDRKIRIGGKNVECPIDIDFNTGTLAYCEDPNWLFSAPPQQKNTTSQSVRDAFSAFVRKVTHARIHLNDWGAESIARALKEQESRIANDFRELVIGRSYIAEFLNFDYVINGKIYSEEQFFEYLLDENVDVIVELRGLIATYLTKFEGSHNPWQSEVGPALGSAMRTLILLDPDSLDLLRLFLVKRDMEHEDYCYRRIIVEFFERCGWNDERTLRLGIFLLLRGEPLNPADLKRKVLEAAAIQFDIDDLVELVIDEIEFVSGHSDEDESALLRSWCADLDHSDSFQQKLLATLKPHLTED